MFLALTLLLTPIEISFSKARPRLNRQADVDDNYLTGDESDIWEDCDDKIYVCDSSEDSSEEPAPATPDPFKHPPLGR